MLSAPASNQTGSAILLAMAGFSCLTMGDAIIKTIVTDWPVTGVAALRYAIGTTLLAALLYWKEGPGGFRMPRPWVHIGRGFAISFAAIFFFAGLFFMPLAETTVIQFVSPMLVALLSGLILKEHAPRAAWFATLAAFAGVLVVLRPEVARIGWAGVLPLIAAFFMALTLVLNRLAAGQGSTLLMQFLISACATPVLIVATAIGHFSGIKMLQISVPTASVILGSAIVACSASLAHTLVFMATSRASAAHIAPAHYVQLIVALGLGALIFGHYPDATDLAGAALIIGAGLYLWKRG